MKKPKPVYVEWVDSEAHNGWQHEIHASVLICRTRAYLIEKMTDHIAISSTWSANESWLDPLIIPRCAIKKIKYLPCEDGE